VGGLYIHPLHAVCARTHTQLRQVILLHVATDHSTDRRGLFTCATVDRVQQRRAHVNVRCRAACIDATSEVCCDSRACCFRACALMLHEQPATHTQRRECTHNDMQPIYLMHTQKQITRRQQCARKSALKGYRTTHRRASHCRELEAGQVCAAPTFQLSRLTACMT